jgi:hypothetical protein|tara:strand:+ start:1238 stop:1774 length:537 start_codon:yes stop_codon:yes gene_type:complete
MEMTEPKLDAPIPGMSLTHELGARPWQQPSQYSTMDEVIDYYITRMASEDFETSLLNTMEMNIPLTIMANTIQLAGVMEGKHNVDTGLLVLPILIEMMMLIGDKNKVKYDSGLENETKNKPNKAMIARVLQELKEEMKDNETDDEDGMLQEDDMETMPIEEPVIAEEEEPKGLMARRI